MGFKYSEVKENGLIPNNMLQYIPDHCECGSELEFNDSLTKVYCTDKYCPYKIAARLEAMAEDLGAIGWNNDICVKVVKYFKLKSPLQVFIVGNMEKEVLETAGNNAGLGHLSDLLENICGSDRRNTEVWQLIEYMHIGELSLNSRKLFYGYNSIEDVYADFEKYQVPLIMERLGITKSSETSVLAISLYEKLIEYKDELLAAEKYFKIKKYNKIIKVVISDNMDKYTNKGEFISYLNEIGSDRDKSDRDKFVVHLMNTISTQTDIYICDNDTDSKKYKAACKVNEKAKYTKIRILTSDNCIRALS